MSLCVLIGIAIISFLYLGHKRIFGAIWTFWRKIIAIIYLIKLKISQKPIYSYNLFENDLVKLGMISSDNQRSLENPRALPTNIYAGDTIEFWGIDNQGNALVLHLTRRLDRCAEIWVYLKLKCGEEYQSITHPDTRIYNTDGKTFSAGGLTLEPLHSMRRWRIIYRGALRKGIHNTWDPNNCETVKVCANFVWTTGYHPYSLRQHFDINSVAEAISKSKLSLFKLATYNVDPEEQTEQWGQLAGVVRIKNEDEIKINLWGPKVRTHGVQNWKNKTGRQRLHVHTKGGSVLSLCANEEFNGVKNIIHGYFVPASNINRQTVSNVILKTNSISPFISSSDRVVIKVTAGEKKHLLSYNTQNFGFKVYEGDDWECEISTLLIEGTFNNEPMVGFLEFSRPHHNHCPLPNRKSVLHINDIGINTQEQCAKQVIQLTDPSCRNCDLVGGKAASLAFMMTLKDREKFEVPLGVCVTNVAFNIFSTRQSSIIKEIITLEDIAWKKTEGSLQTQCQTVIDTIMKSTFPDATKDFIHEELQRTFGSDYEKLKFAVRSSAIGEDGEETSAAGQNETFLGVNGLAQICDKILKCWASQFAFRSVEYKRKNGQLINGGMAVVIQLMVPSDVSGVIFTTDPVTGCYGYVTITANYGLGESVVSGTSEPDTIVLSRNWNDSLNVLRTEIGKKAIKTVMKDEGGTEEQNTDATEATKCTLNDETALKLGQVAIFLENSYGTPRDIEWAMCKKKIYLLQCRPITTHLQETQHELIHEFDSCRITENERYNTANVAEALPGALSPLCVSGLLKIWHICAQRLIRNAVKGYQYNPLPCGTIGCIYYSGHIIADQIYQKLYDLSEKPSPVLYAVQLAMYGRIVDDNDVHQLALQRYRQKYTWGRIKVFYESFLKSMLTGRRTADEGLKKFGNYELPLSGITNSEDLLRLIEDHMFDIDEAFTAHMRVTTASMIWNFLILAILRGNAPDFTLDMYNDFANLIGRANGAISGDVPFSLQILAKTIAKENKEAFSTMSAEMALNWLQNYGSESRTKFREFLRRHGHRGYKELELSAVTWKRHPIKLVKVLQPLVASYGTNKPTETQPIVDDVLENLKTPISFIKRWLLRYVMMQTRQGIVYREKGKSLMVKVTEGIRDGYMKLAEMLVKEGKLSDENMIFFLTHEEIAQVIKQRSSRILNRAAHRMRVHPQMDSMRFPEFIIGDPKSTEELREEAQLDDTGEEKTKINAYPVSQGTAKGPARVVPTFEYVDQIKPGDILITLATDIAWSPYFPMLAGVVTEIGGLISHGAVVAREYGLPCIVGAEGATKIFKSGEMVLLNATKGTLEKCIEENS